MKFPSTLYLKIGTVSVEVEQNDVVSPWPLAGADSYKACALT